MHMLAESKAPDHRKNQKFHGGEAGRERETERGLSPELLVLGISSLHPAPVYLTITFFTHPLPGGNSLGSLATKQGSPS